MAGLPMTVLAWRTHVARDVADAFCGPKEHFFRKLSTAARVKYRLRLPRLLAFAAGGVTGISGWRGYCFSIGLQCGWPEERCSCSMYW